MAAPIAIATISRIDRDGLGVLDGDAEGRGQRDRHAGDPEGDALAGRLVSGEPGEREDEQQRRDDVGGRRDGLQVDGADRRWSWISLC